MKIGFKELLHLILTKRNKEEIVKYHCLSCLYIFSRIRFNVRNHLLNFIFNDLNM